MVPTPPHTRERPPPTVSQAPSRLQQDQKGGGSPAHPPLCPSSWLRAGRLPTWAPGVEEQEEFPQEVGGRLAVAGVQVDLELVAPNGGPRGCQHRHVCGSGPVGDVAGAPGAPGPRGLPQAQEEDGSGAGLPLWLGPWGSGETGPHSQPAAAAAASVQGEQVASARGPGGQAAPHRASLQLSGPWAKRSGGWARACSRKARPQGPSQSRGRFCWPCPHAWPHPPCRGQESEGHSRELVSGPAGRRQAGGGSLCGSGRSAPAEEEGWGAWPVPGGPWAGSPVSATR